MPENLFYACQPVPFSFKIKPENTPTVVPAITTPRLTYGEYPVCRFAGFRYSFVKDPHGAQVPIYAKLLAVTQQSYQRKPGGGYLSKSLPPVEFQYTLPTIDEAVREVDPVSLENLPCGLDGRDYQMVDLDGEGLPGILSEQGGSWFYKRNLSPVNRPREGGNEVTLAQFGPLEMVAQQPSLAAAGGGGQQFLDLAGDGQLDVVWFDGPTPGFYERTGEEGWEPFRSFRNLPDISWKDPNLKFVDLNGDGHADILISRDEVFWWHPSLAEEGFGPAQMVVKALDEEKGPKLVFADGTQSIYLADLSGDGLSDLVRLGKLSEGFEVCYWPNLGYCRFGAKVTMDNPPQFDYPDIFNPNRIRLADVDGSGTTDIIYLHGEGIHVYFNQSGNGWSERVVLQQLPAVDNVASVQAMDLLGNGTACLVWSSPLPGAARQPMRYVDLMGGQKPHLLKTVLNNLGAQTDVLYAPSTRFYLADRQEGKPWATRIPFPVHVVEKVTVTDHWRKTVYSSSYSYHHGYFDGVEREFRGFGRVEQVDVESYGVFEKANASSPYITADKMLYQPPVKTVTWFHTGAFLDRERIISQFDQEYFPKWFEAKHPDKRNVLGGFEEHRLPQPDIDSQELSPDEWREALRACKGMMLRQEVYELDVAALENPDKPEQIPGKLFSTAYHNCQIQTLQRQGSNRHAVFLVAESEAITYHYELDLTRENRSPDPRIAHTLNLNLDQYGNVLQSVAVAYPRRGTFQDDAALAKGLTDSVPLINSVQLERHMAYSEARYTDAFEAMNDAENVKWAQDHHRLPVSCEVLTCELTGVDPKDGKEAYFSVADLRGLRLSPAEYQRETPGDGLIDVAMIPYQQPPQPPEDHSPELRIVEHVRTLFFAENLVDPLKFREQCWRGLLYETYKLALTDSLLDAVFTQAGKDKLVDTLEGAMTARGRLQEAKKSGYLNGADLAARFATLPAPELAGQYWIRSGIAGFAADAAEHYYLPECYTDPFGNVTTLAFDPRDLYLQSSTDMLGNTTRVTQFDFRVLAPREMQDINDNLSEVYFDVLGLPTAMALKGKGDEGDNLSGFDDAPANSGRIKPTWQDLNAFFNARPDLDETQTRFWLGSATARHLYYFGEIEEKLPDGTTVIHWGQHPACASGIVRETHVAQLAPGEECRLQASFEYSDGMGSVLVKKVQAEPEKKGGPLRWVASGKTILNNKGKPVKKYEPYFSAPEVGHRFEEPKEEGVTPIIYYDAVGRTVRTEMPDGSYSRAEFSPWQVRAFDQNDTLKEPGNAWFANKSAASTTEKRAAQLAGAHADTPALTILDSLGREVISVAHNRVTDTAGLLQDEKYLTFTKLDAEGKPLWIRDARKNLVMQYIAPPAASDQEADPADFVPCYDIAGNLLHQHSMDAGDRWMLNDAAGKPMLAWNSRGHLFRTDYDPLHRPTGSFIKGADPHDANRIIQFERVIYGDTPGNGLTVDPLHPENDQTKRLNLRGKPYQHFDSAGKVDSLGSNPATGADEAFDFKGNLLRSTRQLVSDYQTTPDWSQVPGLEAEIFSGSTSYDGLNRPIQVIAPHSDQPGTKFNVTRPGYNEANLLETVNVWLEQVAEPTILLDPATANLNAVTNIDYDAKGQHTRIEYNEANSPMVTEYSYDKETFRLTGMLSMRPKHSENEKLKLQDLSYTYDPVGNITDIRDAAQQRVFFNNSTIEPSNSYEYDALYRLIRAEGREHAVQNNIQRDAGRFEPVIGIPFPNSPEALQNYREDYQYDPVGNIMALTHTGDAGQRWVRRYQYATDSNRLLATRLPGDPDKLPDYVAAPGGYSAKYTYDDHGNMTSMPQLKVMEWDFKDQLQSTQQQVNNGGTGETTWYVYDASGQRVRKVTELSAQAGQVPRRKDERIYLGGYEVYRKYNGNDQAPTLGRETLHVMDDKQRVALVETRTLPPQAADPTPRRLVRFQLGNHLGSAALEMDDHAQVISYEEYHPYGTTAYEAARSQSETPKRYRYTGKERDEETGFSYHGARYYAGWLGRWVSADPGGLVDGPNLFRYVGGNPVKLVDPSGRQNEHTQPEYGINPGINPTKHYQSPDQKLASSLGAVRDPKLAAQGRPDLKTWDSQFKGPRGEQFRKNVQDAAKEMGVDPGLLAANALAEVDTRDFWLNGAFTFKGTTTTARRSDIAGLDFWVTSQAGVKAAVPSAKGINASQVGWFLQEPKQEELKKITDSGQRQVFWEKNRLPVVGFTDAKTALRALAAMTKFHELQLQKLVGAEAWGRFTDAERFALTRFSFNAGPNAVKKPAAQAAAGEDILVRSGPMRVPVPDNPMGRVIPPLCQDSCRLRGGRLGPVFGLTRR